MNMEGVSYHIFYDLQAFLETPHFKCGVSWHRDSVKLNPCAKPVQELFEASQV